MISGGFAYIQLFQNFSEQFRILRVHHWGRWSLSTHETWFTENHWTGACGFFLISDQFHTFVDYLDISIIKTNNGSSLLICIAEPQN